MGYLSLVCKILKGLSSLVVKGAKAPLENGCHEDARESSVERRGE